MNKIISGSYNAHRINKIPIYFDWDGVIKDTNRYVRNLLLEEYGIDKWTHKRENIEDDKKVAEFFKNFDWAYHFDKIPLINDNVFDVIKLMLNSGIYYEPCILSAYSSEVEKEIKKVVIPSMFPKCSCVLVDQKYPKKILDSNYSNINYSILVDDDPFNLKAWKQDGISIPFNGGNPNYNFPMMENLEEILHLFLRVDKDGKEFIPLYDDGTWKSYSLTTKFDINPDTGYLETPVMKNRYSMKLKMKK